MCLETLGPSHTLDATLVIFGVGAAALVLLLYPLTARVDVAAARRLRELQPRIAALEGVGIFAAASRTALERLAVAATEESVPAGTRIIREGDSADAFYVLADGEVRVSARGEAGEETVLSPPLRACIRRSLPARLAYRSHGRSSS